MGGLGSDNFFTEATASGNKGADSGARLRRFMG